MSVRSDTLRLLEGSRGKRLSGEDIAERLGCTRAAVWKAVKSLIEAGYDIDGQNNSGYMLSDSTDILSAEGVYAGLAQLHKKKKPIDKERHKIFNLKETTENNTSSKEVTESNTADENNETEKYEIIVYDSIDSTNEELKRRAVAGAGAGLVVISDEQTAGKGRRGRSFYSPKGSGLYISMLFKPHGKNSEDIVLITTQAAVAVSLAIESVYGRQTQIKWVNDVYIDNKKACGILTEAISDFESGGIDMVMVGIGINVRRPAEIPDDLRDIIGYIINEPTDTLQSDTDDKKNNKVETYAKHNTEAINLSATRNQLAAAIIDNLYTFYEALPDRSFMHDYRVRSNVIGKQVTYTRGYTTDAPGEDAIHAKAVGITDDGGLIVQLADGHEEVLHTGEVTLRVIHTHSIYE